LISFLKRAGKVVKKELDQKEQSDGDQIENQESPLTLKEVKETVI